MRTGVVFPQAEIGDDPVLVRDFAQTAEGLGYTHLLVFDHVLGAGDSIYYDSIVPHEVRAYGDDPARILAVVYAPA